MIKNWTAKFRAIFGSICLISFLPICPGETATWINAGADFNTGSNWTTGAVPGPEDFATFIEPPETFAQPVLNSSVAVSGLRFSADTTAAAYRLSGGSPGVELSLNSNGTGADAAISSSHTAKGNVIDLPIILTGQTPSIHSISAPPESGSPEPLFLNGPISSVNEVSLILDGMVALNAANTYRGITHLPQTKTWIGNKAAFGSSTLHVTGFDYLVPTAEFTGIEKLLNTISLETTSAAGTPALTIIDGHYSIEFGGDVSAVGGGAIVSMQNEGTATLSGLISGGGHFEFRASLNSSIRLTGDNTFPFVTLYGYGTISVPRIGNAGEPGPLGTAQDLFFNRATLRYTGPGETTNRVLFPGAGSFGIESSGTGPLIFSSSLPDQTGPYIDLILAGTNTNENTLSGVIPTLINISKKGPGTWILSGANTYAGTTSVEEGTLRYSGAGVLGSGALSVSGGSLDIGPATQTITAPMTLNRGSIVSTGDGELISPTYLLTNEGSITARLAGSGSLEKTGTGTVVITGSNTYTGVTAIREGSLEINSLTSVGGGPSALGSPVTEATGKLALGNGANSGRLIYSGPSATSDRIISLEGTTGGGVIENSGIGVLTLTAPLSVSGKESKQLTLGGTSSGVFAGAIADGPAETSLRKEGSGTWTLSGPNSYSGETLIHAGRLNLVSTASVGSGGFTITEGSILSAEAPLTIPGTVMNSGRIEADNVTFPGVLRSTGHVTGLATIGGTLQPGGPSTGTATFGSLTLNPGSTTTLQISGAATRDSVVVDDRLTLGGTIAVSLDYSPSETTSFTLFEAGEIAPAGFDPSSNLVLPSVSGFTWDKSEFLSHGRLRLVNQKIEQTIRFVRIPDRVFNPSANTVKLSATASSKLTVFRFSVVSGPATVQGNTLVVTGAGTITVAATQPGNTRFMAATATQTFAVAKRPQTISFAPPGRLPSDAPPFVLKASSTSGLPVVFAVVDGPGVLGVDGKTLGFSDAGTIILRASQEGDGNFEPATPVLRTIISSGEKQTIAFNPPSTLVYGTAPVPLLATASHPDLKVAFSVSAGPAELAVDGQTLVITGAGNVILRATQAGGHGYSPAPPVIRTITVRKARLLVTARDYTRLVGEPNPESFALDYAGFVNGETEDVLGASRPSGRTTAKINSPQGEYAITVSGGRAANYRFDYARGTLAILGFGGTYEALLVDDQSTPLGKLVLTISNNSNAYSGILDLAMEAKPLAIKNRPQQLLVSAPDGSSCTGIVSVGANGITYDLAVTLSANGAIVGDLLRDTVPVGRLEYGSRVRIFDRHVTIPGAGTNTLIIHPSPAYGDTVPGGAGHASATISSDTGRLRLSGRLADGSLLTASSRPLSHSDFALWVRPYGQRTQSFLAGQLVLKPHPDTGRFPDRFYIPTTPGVLTWAKEAPLANAGDKAYANGFGPLLLGVSLDPWLAPTRAIPLIARLDIPSDESGDATMDVSHGPAALSLGSSADTLPTTLSIANPGSLYIVGPNLRAWKITSLAINTGRFTGAFTLSDQVAPPPAKPFKRTVNFSGTLRQAPDSETILGAGFFLLSPLPDSSVSGDASLRSGIIEFTLPLGHDQAERVGPSIVANRGGRGRPAK
jgi:autotransporter-associated beta strand protein